jgi:hypothetical protein
MVNKIVIAFSCVALVSWSCGDSRTNFSVRIDQSDNGSITVLDESDFVIDSLVITGRGMVYFSKGLTTKLNGSSKTSIGRQDLGYKIYTDSLRSLTCGDHFIGMDIILRKRGSNVKVTNDIAQGFRRIPEIYIVKGVKYIPCSKEVDTLLTERPKY